MHQAEKQSVIDENRRLLVDDLGQGRTRFQSRPWTVDLQLSNFCNMSCTMCYDGNNPPLLKMPEEILEKVKDTLLPTASVLVPFSGSEPLILTWDLTQALAEEFGLELDIITHLQYLDETKFAEMEPHVSVVTFSIDTHMPDIYEAIRLRSKPGHVFRNLPVAARLCREHGIQAEVNAVFMVENAPWMDDTVRYMADQGVDTMRILRYLHFVEGRQNSDPLLHMSPEWVTWKQERIREAAREKQVRVLWEVTDYEDMDYRKAVPELRASRKNDELGWALQHYRPGYCIQVASRIKVDARGGVYPCCVAEGENLRLGDLATQDFEEIWNGVQAQDLRRGMMCDDVPDLCQACSFYKDKIGPEQDLGYFTQFERDRSLEVLDRRVQLQDPHHMLRTQKAPTLSWTATPKTHESLLLLTLGGESEEVYSYRLQGDCQSFDIPLEDWEAMRSNYAYWWTVWTLDDQGWHRASEIRCFLKHVPLPRSGG